ncbi:MAG: PBP1A family penicillin-binding protein [candidate division KSB1 bacterium]|nr:PBP1A family penicillin-binding protein [candidate division KSB1 bacterium]MDQ7066147.1 PBP1A family penicillin-binding protein [candidate division KSB1 bacterium]
MKKKIITYGIVGLILMGGAGGYLYYLIQGLPSLNKLEEYRPRLASKVYSADGKVIHDFYYEERRTYVPLEEMPPYMWQAVVAIEDRRFFDHWGLDLKRIAKAIVVDLISLSAREGASTLTQQLARQLYMNQSLEKTITRKFREQLTAIQIERTYTKREILDIYLNYMNFGHGSYGVQSAAQFYFGKDARDLTLPECAMLAGLLQRPAALSPYVNPDRALARRNLVLAAMKTVGYISDEEYEEAVAQPLGVLKEKPRPYHGIAPYFVEYIRRPLQKKYGFDLYTGGLKIYTTLDTRVQYFADLYVKKQIAMLQEYTNRRLMKEPDKLLEVLGESYLDSLGLTMKEFLADTSLVDSVLTEKLPVQAALVALDPTTGYVLAMVGGRDFDKYKFNRATQARRQPGSAFKPFLYTAVIDNGYPPTLELLNQPVVVFLENGQRWSPHNYNETMGGLTTIREGLQKSLNLISVRLIQEVTKPAVVVEYARKMGISTPIPAVDAIALGAGSVIPLEITNAYGVFANQGVLMEPIAVMRVEDQYGNILEENVPHGREVLRKATAYIMTDLLKSVLNGGTGSRARWMYHFYRPAGGKTGTTNDYTDAWFVGFTPQIVAGVWVGFDDPAQTLGEGQTGSKAALPIWAPFMKAAHDTLGLPEEDFPMPDNVVRVEICKESKKLANPECPEVYKEVFMKEYEPTLHCDIHTGLRRTSHRRRRLR